MLRYYVVAIVAFAVDQFIKWSVATFMDIGQKIPLISGFIQLTSIRNRGAAFGILQNQRLFFIVVTTIVLIGIIFYLYKIHRKQKELAYALALIFGGALGNFVDRALHGEVVDMLEFTFINYPVFNLADVYIVTGGVLVMINTLRVSRTEKA
ncbi:signal peptidase II [Paenibacillus sp. LC231]|uniref:Lipoprotein signal peptidase n=1 Tax=Paenibacillus lautus TaxID=1401 RepID=A0A385U0A0_PAELA|nr:MULTISPECIES: signal peptidase II [Paenibacillus]VTR35719.1 lipoprotein signal peptidase [Actinobacillus pleuropneumoniae]AWP25134.1 signal peptidase II [Paenibacillus sp. Cedars]AYB48142.1 signal peptidase II [Paenibacillus lautus]MBX4152519.1 signal peptidase II [Paenibacillus lautus]OIB00580.1 signal peptidase II [Paenibacillus sp. LC231]